MSLNLFLQQTADTLIVYTKIVYNYHMINSEMKCVVLTFALMPCCSVLIITTECMQLGLLHCLVSLCSTCISNDYIENEKTVR